MSIWVRLYTRACASGGRTHEQSRLIKQMALDDADAANLPIHCCHRGSCGPVRTFWAATNHGSVAPRGGGARAGRLSIAFNGSGATVL